MTRPWRGLRTRKEPMAAPGGKQGGVALPTVGHPLPACGKEGGARGGRGRRSREGAGKDECGLSVDWEGSATWR
jgi:hypothetical protein